MLNFRNSGNESLEVWFFDFLLFFETLICYNYWFCLSKHEIKNMKLCFGNFETLCFYKLGFLEIRKRAPETDEDSCKKHFNILDKNFTSVKNMEWNFLNPKLFYFQIRESPAPFISRLMPWINRLMQLITRLINDLWITTRNRPS